MNNNKLNLIILFYNFFKKIKNHFHCFCRITVLVLLKTKLKINFIRKFFKKYDITKIDYIEKNQTSKLFEYSFL